MSADSIGRDSKGPLWRSRWAAVGAAVAVTFGAGGLAAVNAAGGESSTTVLTDPVRVLDSRDPLNIGLAGPFASQVSQKLQITGSIPTTSGTKTVVPTGATGVLLNVTAVAPTANGFVSIRPGDATGTPSTSSLNVSAGQIVPNAVLVALPTSGADAGKIEITYDAFDQAGPTTDILIDVVGHTSSIDVYTKAEIDASVANVLKAAGEIRSTGSVRTNSTIGQISASRTFTGSYTVTVPGLRVGCSGGVLVSLTAFSGTGDRVALSTYGTSCASGDVTFNVRTFSSGSTTLADSSFFFEVRMPAAPPLSPGQLANDWTTCIVDDTGVETCS